MWDCNVSENLRLPAPDDHRGRDRSAALAEAFVSGMEADFDLASYQWIGYSILSDTLPITLGVIQLIRQKYPKAFLVGGNHEATVNIQDCLGKSMLDAIVMADAEEPVLALMRGEPPHTVPGVIWRNFNPKPSREKFEEWNDAIQWSDIPYEAYWSRTRKLYDFESMTEEEKLDKEYEIATVRVHSLVACELACTFSVSGDTIVITDHPVPIASLVAGSGKTVTCDHGETVVEYPLNTMVDTPMGRRLATAVVDEGVRPVLRIIVNGGASIAATHNHQFLGPYGWRRADELQRGDLINVYNHRERCWQARPILIVLNSPPERVYDLTVPGEEAFIANDFVAHNCSVKTTRRWASGSNKPSIINLSPDALERNFLAIKKQVPGVKTIYDSCDEAFLGRSRAMEYLGVLERIKPIMDAGLPRGLRWLIQCRTNDLSEEIIDYCARVGVKHLTIGVESPVAQVRKDMRKPQSEDLVRNVARWCTERGVNAYMLFIMFFPTITLEQLYDAVENWREYIRLGATISIEPFAMSYIGTDIHDDASFLTEYAGYEIPFSGTPAKRLKWATLIWPNDRRVCAILVWLRDNVDAFIDAHRKKVGHAHMFKGETGSVLVDCLEYGLKLYEQGKIPPWEPGGEGRKSMVMQDYGDQMSGSEIAAAANTMLRANKTATRFNSTHSLLDASGGVNGRIKDPALPHEMIIKNEE